jgi:hypothetical protein
MVIDPATFADVGRALVFTPIDVMELRRFMMID